MYLAEKSVCPRSSAEHFASMDCSTENSGESQHSVKAIKTETSFFKFLLFHPYFWFGLLQETDKPATEYILAP